MSSTVSFKIPVIPEPPVVEDPTMQEYLRRVKDAINQLADSVNSIGSRFT